MAQESMSSAHVGLSKPETIPSVDSTSTTSPAAKEEEAPWSVQFGTLSKLHNPPPPTTQSILPFTHLLERLKTTPRKGWKIRQLKDPESISDHMYRMSILTMLAPASLSSKLDIPRCTKMALVHDMAELLVGDITPQDKVDKAEKNRREATTMEYLTKSLLGGVAQRGISDAGVGIMSAWQEYEDNLTLEAKFVHDIDKVELIFQMMEYERRERVDLGEFVHVAKKIELPEVQAWCVEVLNEREEFWKEVRGGDLSEVRGLDDAESVREKVKMVREG